MRTLVLSLVVVFSLTELTQDTSGSPRRHRRCQEGQSYTVPRGIEPGSPIQVVAKAVTSANQQTYVRKDVSVLSQAEIDALRKGVEVMKARDAKDKTSWLYQANIHGTTDDPLLEGWAQCQHGSYFFFSWHRMYLYYFERILRKASGDPNLALPYWNWSLPSQRALPAIFRMPADPDTNSLFVAERNQSTGNQDGINDGAELPGPATSYAAAFARTNFFSSPGSGLSFGGQQIPGPEHQIRPHGKLESQPHDILHGLIGGDGWMGDPDFAARDPIFWLHHANIDRLWKRWLDQGGRQNPLTDKVWMTTKFSFFDEDGNKVELAGKDILDTVAQLGYRYDDDPPPNIVALIGHQNPAREVAVNKPKILFRLEKKGELGLQQSTVPVPLSKELLTNVRSAISEKKTLILAVDDIRFEKNPGVYYEVYLNLPEKTEPDPHSIFHIGNLGFFSRKAHAPKGHKVAFDITQAVQALQKANAWNDKELKVSFVMRGLIPPKGKRALHKEGKRAEFSGISLSVQ